MNITTFVGDIACYEAQTPLKEVFFLKLKWRWMNTFAKYFAGLVAHSVIVKSARPKFPDASFFTAWYEFNLKFNISIDKWSWIDRIKVIKLPSSMSDHTCHDNRNWRQPNVRCSVHWIFGQMSFHRFPVSFPPLCTEPLHPSEQFLY